MSKVKLDSYENLTLMYNALSISIQSLKIGVLLANHTQLYSKHASKLETLLTNTSAPTGIAFEHLNTRVNSRTLS